MDGPAATSTKGDIGDDGAVLDYLCVDYFLASLVEARALSCAFEMGLIDYLIRNRPATADQIARGVGGDEQGLQLLCRLLRGSGVIEECDGDIRLTRRFAEALRFRDVLEAKLEFAHLAVLDVAELFSSVIRKPGEFCRRARMFNLFDYSRCFDRTTENYRLTRRWMRITTSLTKYEALVCMKYHDFSRYRQMMDIGGNSGEFALRICRRHPEMLAVVFDLPLVCDIGREHVQSEPEAERIRFIPGNALCESLPTDFDVVTFKSVLHDWPEEEAGRLIQKASQSLKAGGTILIFERGPLDIGRAAIPYSMIPFLLFFRSFRSPALYEKQLKELGFQQVTVKRIDLETPWFCVQGSKRT